MKRILLAVDVSNLYYCLNNKFTGARLDYKKFYEVIKNLIPESEIHRAIAYGSESDNPKKPSSSFKSALQHIGFEVKFKNPKSYTNDTGEIKKSDWDVGMAIDIVQILDSVDIVVLASADGDMAPCIDHINSRGKICIVYACNISRELKDRAQNFIEIGEDLL